LRIICISASNIKHSGENSTSLTVCRMIENIATMQAGDAEVDIMPLVKHELRPCTGCGACFHAGRCTQDDEFNSLYSRLADADCVFIVAARPSL
jgi:multimeric flavodoxin WrbA